MAAPTRFPSGVSTEGLGTPLQNFPFPNPNSIVQYSSDFVLYDAADWTVNAGGAGSGNALSTVLPNGVLAMTCATSGAQSIMGGPAFSFLAPTSTAAGRQVWFDCDITLDATVANPDYQIGLAKGTASSLNNTTDGVYFTKATAATVWSLVIKNGGTASTFALPASTLPVNSAEIGLSFWYDAKPTPTLWVYFNEVLIGTVCNETLAGGPIGTLGTRGANNLANLPVSTTYLSVCALNAFHTATSILNVDYITAGCEASRF